MLVFYFIAKLFTNDTHPLLLSYGGDYFSFVFIGIAFSSYIGVGMGSFAINLRNEQLTGTLESLLVTPNSISSIIFYLSAWNFVFATFEILIYVVLGIFVFGVKLTGANLVAAIFILFLSMASFMGFGMIAASVVMIFKRGNPVSWVFGNVSDLLGGVYFPVAVLPSFIQPISCLFPVTYAVRAMRHALLQCYSFKMLLPDILMLVMFCFVLIPLGFFLFKKAISITKYQGTLIQY